MIQELQKYPKAWGEFAEYVLKGGEFEFDDDNKFIIRYVEIADTWVIISDRELQSYIIEWLDSKGLYVMYDISDKNLFHWLIVLRDDIYSMPIIQSDRESTKTRQQATEAGILKSFQILEGK